ncbi:MAG: glycosyltransferase [Oscillibacter sp.]|jgi:glycosyltransferase involved in cell wall biosynthesis|nr:glycosyltransferase [Oscillibacter sp.]
MTDVTVVLPVYNGSQYLSQAIESILAQTFQNWELIIVDDCSADSSLKIAEGYAQRDNRIQIIHNAENQKLPRSLNIGFANAKGKYLTWTSDDNLYQSRALEVMVSFLDTHPEYGLVYCDMEYIDESGNVISNTQKSSHNLYLSDCVGACFMYRREVAETVGGYDPNKFLVEDYDYWLRISFQYSIGRVPELLYSYRHHSGNMTAVYGKRIASKVFDLLLEYLDKISDRLDDHDFFYYCIGLLLNKPEAGQKLDELAAQRGIPFHSEKIAKHNSYDPNKRFIIFGAGVLGRQALQLIGHERTAYFADNMKYGQFVDEIPIISAERMEELQFTYNIMIAADFNKTAEIIEQMDQLNVTEYSIFLLIKDQLQKGVN